MVLICPSILSADFANLSDAIEAVTPETDRLHVDVMDGHFVPNLTIGPPVVASLRRATSLFLDCHLMISEPHRYLEAFAKAGANGCTVHVEIGNTAKLLDQTRSLGMAVGLVANPDTEFERFAPFLAEVDLILLMTVFPGFGGQAFMDSVLPKIEQTRAELDRLATRAILQVDGGIDERTGQRCAAAGATAFVAGNAIFNRPNPLSAAAGLRAAVVAGAAGVPSGSAVSFGPRSEDGYV